MRWSDGRTWEAMVDWATRLHDGIYASQSPMPAPRLVGCTNPEAQCVKLAIAAKTADGQWFCTKPSFLPALCAVQDCDRRVYDWREGQGAQSGSKESKQPIVADAKTADIMAWTRGCLTFLAANDANRLVRMAAHMVLHDGDWPDESEPLSERVYEALGERMLDRLCYEKPWVKKVDKVG